MTTFTFSVIDGCANSSAIYNVEAKTQEEAEVTFVKYALPIAWQSFTFDDFVTMMQENDVLVQSLGENTPIVTVKTDE